MCHCILHYYQHHSLVDCLFLVRLLRCKVCVKMVLSHDFNYFCHLISTALHIGLDILQSFNKILLFLKYPTLHIRDLSTKIWSLEFDVVFNINDPYKTLKMRLIETTVPSPTTRYYRYFLQMVVDFMMCLLDLFLEIFYLRLFFFVFRSTAFQISMQYRLPAIVHM